MPSGPLPRGVPGDGFPLLLVAEDDESVPVPVAVGAEAEPWPAEPAGCDGENGETTCPSG